MSALLTTRMVEKPWGRAELPEPFAAPTRAPIGEIWFEPPAALAGLLVKYLFTSEKLSVQVHPTGVQRKDECWLVVAAEPGAVLGIGFQYPIGPAAMRAAALDGSIEELLAWHPVKPGDFVYIPAGTVHAIGAGIALIEIQQNSDVTYRLYDYGRPRELHLDDAVAVANGVPPDPALWRKLAGASACLVEGPYFTLDLVCGPVSAKDELAKRYADHFLVVPLNGAVQVAGEPVRQGECAMAASLGDLAVPENGQCLLARPCVQRA